MQKDITYTHIYCYMRSETLALWGMLRYLSGFLDTTTTGLRMRSVRGLLCDLLSDLLRDLACSLEVRRRPRSSSLRPTSKDSPCRRCTSRGFGGHHPSWSSACRSACWSQRWACTIPWCHIAGCHVAAESSGPSLALAWVHAAGKGVSASGSLSCKSWNVKPEGLESNVLFLQSFAVSLVEEPSVASAEVQEVARQLHSILVQMGQHVRLVSPPYLPMYSLMTLG